MIFQKHLFFFHSRLQRSRYTGRSGDDSVKKNARGGRRLVVVPLSSSFDRTGRVEGLVEYSTLTFQRLVSFQAPPVELEPRFTGHTFFFFFFFGRSSVGFSREEHGVFDKGFSFEAVRAGGKVFLQGNLLVRIFLLIARVE